MQTEQKKTAAQGGGSQAWRSQRDTSPADAEWQHNQESRALTPSQSENRCALESADAPVMRGDSQPLRTTSGLFVRISGDTPVEVSGEPMVRVPLSVFQKGSAELAELPALRARVAELEADLVEMPGLRAECESLGDEIAALKADTALADDAHAVEQARKFLVREHARRCVPTVAVPDADARHQSYVEYVQRAPASRIFFLLLSDAGVLALERWKLGSQPDEPKTPKATAKPAAADVDELRDLRTKNEGMRTFLRKVSDALFDRQAGRNVSDTVMCALQSTASAWAGAGGHVPTTPTTTPAQVDLEEVIAAKAAAPAKPKKSRAKKAAPTTTPAQATSSPVSSGLDVRDGIMCDGAGGVWSSAEARRRDEIDPDWCPEPNWAPDGGRLRYLEEHEARGDAIDGCPDLKALADIRSGKRCALCGRRAWRGEHTPGCPNIDAPASA